MRDHGHDHEHGHDHDHGHGHNSHDYDPDDLSTYGNYGNHDDRGAYERRRDDHYGARR